MKPMIIIPPDLMNAEDIQQLRENGICVVCAADPSKIKFLDPIPTSSSRTQIENAAIKMSRILLNRQWGDYDNCNTIGQPTFARILVDCLVKGTPLDRVGSIEDRCDESYERAKLDEAAKLGREDARAERAKKKEKAA